jgi:uncharacterized protein (TIGR02646 family)
MIYISRNSRDENGRLIRPSTAWFRQATAATRTALQERAAHIADPNIYGHDEVRAALEKLFKDKCAYCESRPTACSDWDVEHYRPKGRVAERQDHPGYYWLTYDWKNLYSVCTHCNQRRRDKPRWGMRVIPYAAGKLDQFPLEDERTRAMRPSQNVRREKTLLIDPCYDDPEDYLSYDLEGQVYALDNNPYGRKTIEICHLQRSRLKAARKAQLDTAVTIIKSLRKAQRNGNRAAINDLRRIIRTHLMADSCPYSAVARAVWRDPEAFGIE